MTRYTMMMLCGAGFLLGLAGCGGDATPGAGEDTAAGGPAAVDEERSRVFSLWEDGIPAFGVFVPDEGSAEDGGEPGSGAEPRYTEEGGARLGANPDYDFLFLNLEGHYDAGAIERIHRGVQEAGRAQPPALLVRIPPLSEAGEEATRARIAEALDAGADGVVLPHVRDVEEAQILIQAFEDTGADVWTPRNPDGTKIAMLMLEDPDAVAQAGEIADLPGYSILACGIGSLTGALGGDREAAEQGLLNVLEEATRAGLPSMITANPETVEERIDQGFLALLASGPEADRTIEVGRAAAGR